MPEAISKLTHQYQITVPKNIRELLGLHRGDIVNFKVTKEGKIILSPVVLREREQAYFWTNKWRSEIKKSEENIRKGKFKTFKSVREMRRHFSAKQH